MSLTTFVTWVTSDLLVVLILLRAVKQRMLLAYPLFFGYLAFVLTNSLMRWVVALSFKRNSSLYHAVYDLPTFVFPLLHIWILWDIYRRIVGYSKTSWRSVFRSMTMVGVLTVPIVWGVSSVKGGHFFYHYHAVTLFLQMAICLQICREAVRAREEIDLGQNLKGILSGLSLMIGCQAVNFVGFLFTQSSSEFFWFFVQFIYLLALILFAYTLWDYAPIFRVDPSYQHRLRKANRELYEILRSLLISRR
ncbi:hypothetical protein MYX82_09470 [Acidobacteria bacterium AH-259-D05]|nr:hypothetical protein [Acidobacteria bacterium AH-259-D05]